MDRYGSPSPFGGGVVRGRQAAHHGGGGGSTPVGRRAYSSTAPRVSVGGRRGASIGAQSRGASPTPVRSTGVAPSGISQGGGVVRRAPAGLTVDEIHCCDVVSLGLGGGIKLEEIVSPPIHRVGSTVLGAGTGIRIGESADMKLYVGGMPYNALTPVTVRFEGSALHISSLHDGRAIITVPFSEIKRTDCWEGEGHQGLKVSCGAIAPTEVVLNINEKARRTTVYKMLMLKTRGVILPITREVVAHRNRRSMSPSVYRSRATDTRVYHESLQHTDTSLDSVERSSRSRADDDDAAAASAPQPHPLPTRVGAASQLTPVASGGVSPRPLGERRELSRTTLQHRYGGGVERTATAAASASAVSGAGARPAAASYAPVDSEVVVRPPSPEQAPSSVSAAAAAAAAAQAPASPPPPAQAAVGGEGGGGGGGEREGGTEEDERERRRQRIKLQLQERRAERARQQQAAAAAAAPAQDDDAARSSPQVARTPVGQIHAASPTASQAAPSTDEEARRIVDEKRLQRQLQYDTMLEEERRLRLMRNSQAATARE